MMQHMWADDDDDDDDNNDGDNNNNNNNMVLDCVCSCICWSNKFWLSVFVLKATDYTKLVKWVCGILFPEPDLMQLENSAEIFNALSDIPGDIEDVDHLLDVRMLGKFQHSSLLDYANIPASTFLLMPSLRFSLWCW